MKSVPKLIRRFVGILMVSMLLLAVVNAAFFAIAFAGYTATVSAWDVAANTAKALQKTDAGYTLPHDMAQAQAAQNVWGILIANDTRQVVWQTDNLPDGIPAQYTLADISDFARGYINGYPTFTGEAKDGLLVLGYPKDSFWKLTQASWAYGFIADLPKNALIALGMNVLLLFGIYAAVSTGLMRKVRPTVEGIQALASGAPVCVREKGVWSELAHSINTASARLQSQAEMLRKKETARANWIAGVSHDIRTPLAMVMGYAAQLESAEGLSRAERQKAAVVVKQSGRIKDLVNDLNLASKLEYDMQPLVKKRESAVALVRQVVVDFMNTSADNRFAIEWKPADNAADCCISVDKGLLKRAVANLMQNSINHNEDGCTVYVSVSETENQCRICVEDSGKGVTDKQMDALANAPHYMACDTQTNGQRHGLGLQLVKQIAQVHGGSVHIDRSAYGGLRVLLNIPKDEKKPA